jgi:hypothetical protein
LAFGHQLSAIAQSGIALKTTAPQPLLTKIPSTGFLTGWVIGLSHHDPTPLAQHLESAIIGKVSTSARTVSSSM